jgi:large subunit ribosomal protein L18
MAASKGNISAARRIGKARRHFRIRKKVAGSPARPRLVVTRSARHIYAQIVDDLAGHTLASASTLDPTLRTADGDKSALARQVGALVAQRAKDKGIGTVVFDRGGNRYHGRIAALADGARENGLEF